MNPFEIIKKQDQVSKKLFRMWDKGKTVKIPPELYQVTKTIAHQYITIKSNYGWSSSSALIDSPKIEIIKRKF